MRQCMDAENLHRRLNKIIGQVKAIDRMVDEDIPCEDVLAQINAAKSALHRVGQIVLEGHINHCVRDKKLHEGGRTLREHEIGRKSGFASGAAFAHSGAPLRKASARRARWEAYEK